VRARGPAWRRSAPDSGASPSRTRTEVGDDPDEQTLPVSERRRGRKKAGRAGGIGLGKLMARPRARGERRKGNGSRGGAGLHNEEGKEKGLGWLGWAAREKKEKKKKKKEWAGPN
jgi:hypothetical protein